MKYVLVDGGDNINTSVDLSGDVDLSRAKTYFVGKKQIPYENFIQLWRVMTKDEYEKQFHSTNRPPSYQGIKWWEEDKTITDDELKF